jgi:hypothetical protein
METESTATSEPEEEAPAEEPTLETEEICVEVPVASEENFKAIEEVMNSFIPSKPEMSEDEDMTIPEQS